MRILVSGSSGLIGTALVASLERRGDSVTRLVRPGSRGRGVQWDPASGEIDVQGLEGHDAVVHLAGENIAGLWTSAKKRRIRDSRVHGTQLLATSLPRLRQPPQTFVSGSAFGFYGDRPSGEALDESAPKGTGFLSDVVQEWEQATRPAAEAGIRVVMPRFGLVLSGTGGSLAPMLAVFRLGLGGRVGTGGQVWSWVAIDDVVGAILFVLSQAALRGPVNVVAPEAVTNAEFTQTLGRVLHRPTFLVVPAFALELAAGEMARELLLGGARVVPRKLREAGYAFKYPELKGALNHVLGLD